MHIFNAGIFIPSHSSIHALRKTASPQIESQGSPKPLTKPPHAPRMAYSRSRSRSSTPPPRHSRNDIDQRSRSPPPPSSRDRSRDRYRYRDEDHRERSPPRGKHRDEDERRKVHKSSTGGFRWKEKKRKDDGEDGDVRDGGGGRDRERERGLKRGYREVEDRRHRDRDQDRDRDRDGKTDRYRDRNRDREEDSDERYQRRHPDKPRRRSQSPSRIPAHRESFNRKKDVQGDEARPAAPTERKEPKRPKISTPSEPMIVVKVNDRLGTTTNVPCLQSDTIGKPLPFPSPHPPTLQFPSSSRSSMSPFFPPPSHLPYTTTLEKSLTEEGSFRSSSVSPCIP